MFPVYISSMENTLCQHVSVFQFLLGTIYLQLPISFILSYCQASSCALGFVLQVHPKWEDFLFSFIYFDVAPSSLIDSSSLTNDSLFILYWDPIICDQFYIFDSNTTLNRQLDYYWASMWSGSILCLRPFGFILPS